MNKLKPQWFQILLALADHRRHGQGIMNEVLKQTGGTMRLWPTSLYGSLKKLHELGWLQESPPREETSGDRRRFYELTELGRRELAAEVGRMQQIVEMAIRKRVLEA